MHIRFVIAATLLCGAIAASAQVREQITVEAVDVPVYVFSNGKPVRHLSKDDFELFVNGKPQPVDYFETVDFAAPPGRRLRRRKALRSPREEGSRSSATGVSFFSYSISFSQAPKGRSTA